MSNAPTVRLVLTAALVAGPGACMPLTPPAKNAGPSSSEKGIQVAVLRQSCAATQESDQYGADLVEASVEVQVRNGATAPATVHRDNFRLLAPDGSALRTITLRASDPLTLEGGASQTFELRFMTHGGLACADEMRLDPDGGIVLGASPIAFEPVSFTPASYQ
jgi:hypothetical protein